MNENERENQKAELITGSRSFKKHTEEHSLIGGEFKAICNHDESANYIRLESLATYSLLDGKRIQLGIKKGKLDFNRIRSHGVQRVCETNRLINWIQIHSFDCRLISTNYDSRYVQKTHLYFPECGLQFNLKSKLSNFSGWVVE